MLLIMHNALRNGKRLLHNSSHYALCMNTPNQRLKQAREAAGFAHAKDAAISMGIPVSTYLGHENGHRGFPASRAPQYARKFKVSAEWLLYGKGDVHAEDRFSLENVSAILAEVMQSRSRGWTAKDAGLLAEGLLYGHGLATSDPAIPATPETLKLAGRAAADRLRDRPPEA